MMRKRVLLAAAAALMLCGCSGKKAAEEQIKLPIAEAEEITYATVSAKVMDLSQSFSYGCTIGYPYAEYTYFPASALVMENHLVTNSKVQKGDVLMVLDSSALDYDISNQQTTVNAAYAAYQSSGSERARLTYEIEKSVLDMMLAEKDAYTIRAPYDGLITMAVRADEGSQTRKGDVCFGISPEDKVTVFIDGNDASRFRCGEKVSVKIDGVNYDAVVVQAPDVGPAGTRTQRAVFDLGEGVLMGIKEKNPMSINAGWATVVKTEERKNVLAVPDSAVSTTGTVYYVTLSDGYDRFRLPVTIGARLGGYTEILNGICEGDSVVG